MQTFTFNHIALSVKDVSKAIAFYQKIFQFKEIENTASNSATRWLSIDGVRQLHLISRPEAEIKTNKAVHFAVATTNFAAFVNLLEELKISYSDWRDTPNKDYVRNDGIQQVYFQDVDGYWIEVNDDI